MSLSDTNLEIFWAIAADEKLLLNVEEFLVNAGEPALQQNLNKLQQDAALALADDLTDPELEQHPERTDDLQGLQRLLSNANTSDLYNGPVLMDAYEPVTQKRLQVLEDVQTALVAYGSEHRHEFDSFLAKLKHVTTMEVTPRAAVPNAPSI